MSSPDLLEVMDCAEDLFEALGVAYDPKVLAIHRLHVLKVFGSEFRALEQLSPAPAEAERRRLLADALGKAYQQFTTPSAGPTESVFGGVQRGLIRLGRKPACCG